MGTLRALLMRHRSAALLAVLVALCMRAVLPAGVMADTRAHVFSVRLCEETLHLAATKVLPTTVLIVAQDSRSQDHGAKPASADSPCAFSVLALASLGGANPVLLALALAFVLALGFCASPAPAARAAPRLWPPLRGPPVLP